MLALKIENLQKTYRNRVQALKGISLEVEAGDFFGLLGPNGAGKSTTIGIMTSMINKTSGKVFINDIDTDEDFLKAKAYMGVVPQEINFNIFQPVMDVVVKQAGYYGIPPSVAKKRAEKYLKQMGLWEKRRQLVRFLSGGMKRRLMIARALVHEPKILILDEPTAGVDIELRRLLWNFLKDLNKKGTTIILTTHYLEEAEQLCRNVAIIDKGRVVENTSVKSLLRKLDMETFIFDLREPLQGKIELEDFPVHFLDKYTLEIDIDSHKNMNDLFNLFNQKNILIKSMRNKVNRLEELFVRLTGDHSYDV